MHVQNFVNVSKICGKKDMLLYRLAQQNIIQFWPIYLDRVFLVHNTLFHWLRFDLVWLVYLVEMFFFCFLVVLSGETVVDVDVDELWLFSSMRFILLAI